MGAYRINYDPAKIGAKDGPNFNPIGYISQIPSAKSGYLLLI